VGIASDPPGVGPGVNPGMMWRRRTSGGLFRDGLRSSAIASIGNAIKVAVMTECTASRSFLFDRRAWLGVGQKSFLQKCELSSEAG
jgi:hypothetical protein